jgi:hypothetical protein
LNPTLILLILPSPSPHTHTRNAPQLLELVTSELAAHSDAVDPEVAAFWEATRRHIRHQRSLEAAGGGGGEGGGGGGGRYSALNV